jgi:tetratricopeptide (TPR) repeat protein
MNQPDLGDRFFQQGLYDVAIQEWQRLSPRSQEEAVMAQNRLATAEIVLGRIERAVDAAEGACRSAIGLPREHPQRIFAHVNLAVAWALGGRLREALTIMQIIAPEVRRSRLSELQLARIQYLHATMELEVGLVSAAMEKLEEARSILDSYGDSDSGACSLNLGLACLVLGDLEQAEALIDLAEEKVRASGPPRLLMVATERVRLALLKQDPDLFLQNLRYALALAAKNASSLGILEIGRMLAMTGIAVGRREYIGHGTGLLATSGRTFEAGWFLVQCPEAFLSGLPADINRWASRITQVPWPALCRAIPVPEAIYARGIGNQLVGPELAEVAERHLVSRALTGEGDESVAPVVLELGSVLYRYARSLARGEPWRSLLKRLEQSQHSAVLARLIRLHEEVLQG